MDQYSLDKLEYTKVRELLLDRAASGLGAGLARQIEPLTDRQRIEQLLAETGELKRLLAPGRSLPMGGLHDLGPLLDRLDAGEEILAIEEILYVGETLASCRTIKSYFSEVDESYPHLCRFDRDIATYPEIEDRIQQTFGGGGTILNKATAELNAIRKQIRIVRGRVQGKLQAVLRSSEVSPYLEDTGIRERGGRPVIAIKARHAGRVAGRRRDKSDSGGTVFIEPDGIHELGDELEAALDREKAEMARILRQLTGLIAASAESLRRALAVLAHIDLTYAKVRLSRDYDMAPPQLNSRGIIRLEQARHPLLLALHQRPGQAAGSPVVPIDVRLGDDFHTLVITGPNTGGKTITLKTIGLLCLMAQSGLHIPAGSGSTVPVFEHIAADIGDEQSIEQSLSTFSSHLRNIAAMLQRANEHSLILLDELGGGTDPTEGAALASAILRYLHARGVRTAVTTHISQLKSLGYTVPGIENASIGFDVETLAPTHELLIGTAGNSNALVIARRLGLPAEVIAGAVSHARDQDGDAVDLVDQLQAAKRAAAADRRLAEEDRRLAAADRAAAAGLEAEWRRRTAGLAGGREPQDGASADPRASLRRLQQEIEQLSRGDASRHALIQSLRRLSASLGEDLRAASAGGRESAAERAPEPGDEVYVRSLDRVGVLRQIDGRKAVVQFGSLPMTVERDDLGTAPPSPEKV